MNRTTQKIVFVLLGVVAIAMTLAFSLARLNRSNTPEFGTLGSIEGRVEVKTPGTGQWLPPIENDHILSGAFIRIGTNGAATLKSNGIKLALGPDSEIIAKVTGTHNRSETKSIHLHAGEIKVILNEKTSDFAIETDFGKLTTNPASELVLTHPAGQSFATLTVISGSAAITSGSDTRQITPESGTVVVDNASRKALWAMTPGFEEVFAGKEGHDAIVFKWGGHEDQLIGNVLIRNLNTGEMTTLEGVRPGSEFTLPSGSYTWVVNAQGLVTSPRRFQIAGSAGNQRPPASNASANVTELPTELPTETQKPQGTPTSNPTQGNHTLVPVPQAVSPEPKPEANPDPQSKKDSQNQSQQGFKQDDAQEPKSETKTSESSTLQNVTIHLIAPKKESEVAITDVAELRVIWQVKGQPASFELEVLGSIGNPSMHFTLDGHRTRQKLKALPPGRYSVRLRAQLSTDQFTPWAETFFDVIQTEAGQLAPTDISFDVNPQKFKGKIMIVWKKSAAPSYQVRVQSPGELAVIQRVRKSQIVIPMPKNGNAMVSICALDANGHIRGCAPEILVP